MIGADHLPSEIRNSPRAVVWKHEVRDGRKTKVPYQPKRPDERAAVDNPNTWGTFEEALAAYADGKADGPGIVLGEGLVGVDIDKCLDPETGAIDPWAVVIVRVLNTYTEISPSGTGLHAIARGQLPPGRRRKGAIEMYSELRYFTVTGEHLEGTPSTIEERTTQLAALHANVFGGNSHNAKGHNGSAVARVSDEDAALIERACRAGNGVKFDALWRGACDGYPSQSEADQALCNHLAFWTGRDEARMDRLFRQSGLMRPKWDQRRGEQTYGERTIASAIAASGNVYVGPPDHRDRAATGDEYPRKASTTEDVPPTGSVQVDDWSTVIPLEEHERPPFPVEFLADWQRDWAEGVAEETQSPLDVAAFLADGMISVPGANKYEVVFHDGWREPINSYSCSILPPGEGKSPPFKKARQAALEFQEEHFREAEKKARDVETKREIIKIRLDAAKKKIIGAKDAADGATAECEFERLRAELVALGDVALPQEIYNDATPESLARGMAANDGRAAVVSAESTILNVVAGRYSRGDPNIDILLNGHDAEHTVVNRVGFGGLPLRLDKPVITLVLALQPEILARLATIPDLVDRGLLARINYSVPRIPVERPTSTPAPGAVLWRFNKNIKALFEVPVQHTSTGAIEVRPMQLTSEAVRILDTFHFDAVRPDYSDGARLAHIRGWARKLRGKLARAAARLRLADMIDKEPSGARLEIGSEYANRAVLLGEYLIPHALAAFGDVMQTDSAISDARRLWPYVAKVQADTIARGEGWAGAVRRDELQNAVRGWLKGGERVKAVDRFNAAIETLTERGYLREGRMKTSKRDLRLYFLNPKAPR